MRERYIGHGQDLTDAVNEIKDLRYPFVLVTSKMPPLKEHETEWDKKMRQMSYFHRTVCVEYAKAAGVTEQEAKYELMLKFGRVGEISQDDTGEFDVVWLDSDKLRVFEGNKKYYVQSIAAMPNDELARLIEQCKHYLTQQYGIVVTEYNRKHKTKEL